MGAASPKPFAEYRQPNFCSSSSLVHLRSGVDSLPDTLHAVAGEGLLLAVQAVCLTLCMLSQVKNCYWQYGQCVPQNPLFFEGSAMVYEELLRRQIVEPIDDFLLGKDEPNFYKSWALGRMMCGANAKPKPLPVNALFQNPEAFQAAMQSCFKQGGCAQPIQA